MKVAQYFVNGKARGKWHVVRSEQDIHGHEDRILYFDCGGVLWEKDTRSRELDHVSDLCGNCRRSAMRKERTDA